MTQRVTLTSESEAPLKPIVTSALQTQARILALGQRRTRERLAAFEQRFGLSSQEFERKFNARDLAESLDFIEWMGEIETLRLINAQHQTLEELKLS